MKRAAKDNRFLIVTGLSGSGKTVVSRALEDFGYYCIDNLPAKLIPDFVDLWLKKKVEIDRAALVIDIREPRFLADFPAVFREIRKKVPVRLIFLEATDEALAKRFNETRRPHPLAPPQAHPRGRPARAEAAPAPSAGWPTRSSTRRASTSTSSRTSSPSASCGGRGRGPRSS